MEKMESLISRICKELNRFAEQGIPASGQGLEMAVKLIGMYRDLENIKYWQHKGDYYDAALDAMRQEHDGYQNHGYSQDGGYSERHHRDSRGRYSRDGYEMRGNYDGGSSYNGSRNMPNNDALARYDDAKHAFRSSQSGSSKDRLVRSANEYMDGFMKQLQDILRDSDCPEEREAIMRQLDRLRTIK